MKSLFIVLEGIDGSGKTTQAKRLCRHFEDEKRTVHSLKEPGGTPLGERIRELFLHSDRALEPLTELLLIEASRHELVEQVIRPALRQGAAVVCQRYTYSSLAYQGYGRGLALDWISELNERATGGLKPDVAIYLDVPVATGMHRVQNEREPDRMEREGRAFLKRVEAGYHKLIEQNSEMVKVDGSLSEGELFQKIVELVRQVEGGAS
ncbi:dTMP kinase [Candidatus Acetothermia bacterium]|nr:dTMP kinase [Candidatus Acetothermia bacterium]MBI3642506.1 dTMP kinase [Candidatus Acetothermia bacterium]